MNWTLVVILSIPGLMMGLLSVMGHTRGIEPYLWLLLALFAALIVARTAEARYFLHGLCVGLAWGVLNGVVASAMFATYARHNPETMQRFGSGGAPLPPQALFLASAPVIGLATGVVLGLLCLGASQIIRPAPRPPATPPPPASSALSG